MDLAGSDPMFLDATGGIVKRMPDAIRPGTSAVIFNERGEVLLERRADVDLWGLPGGAVDIGESVEQALVREVLEETGLHVTLGRLIGIYSDPAAYAIARYPGDGLIHFVTSVFECERVSGELGISEESTDIGYFDPGDLPSDTVVGHRVRVDDAMAASAIPFIR